MHTLTQRAEKQNQRKDYGKEMNEGAKAVNTIRNKNEFFLSF
jgi:hypothetical protein